MRGARYRQVLLFLILALGAASTLFLAYLLDPYLGHFLETVEAKLVDLRFRIRGPLEPSGDVVIVAIDRKSTEALGRWPWPRSTHAALVDQLRGWGASAVAFDVLFPEEEGAREAARLRRVAATLPDPGPSDRPDPLEAVRLALGEALREVELDRIFAAALARTFEDDKALPVLAFDFVLAGETGAGSEPGRLLSAADEQIVLDLASYHSRAENTSSLRRSPPRIALGLRPVVTSIAEWSAALGFANPIYDIDGTLRRDQIVVVYSPLLREAGASAREALLDPEATVEAYMSLPVASMATHLRLSMDAVELDLPAGELRFRVPGEASPRRVPFDPFDGTSHIDFLGPAQTFPTYPFVDVLRDDLHDAGGHPISGSETFAGKLVMVGATDPGAGDVFVTPFTSRLPGVEKHANVVEGMLHDRVVRTHEDEDLAVGITVLVTALVTGMIAASLHPLSGALVLLVLALGSLTLSYRDFTANGLLWNWSLPLLTLGLAYAVVTTYRGILERGGKRAMEARSRYIKEAFGRYLSDEVVDLLVDSPGGLRLGGERRRVTILMSDLRGFTALCERSSPDAVIGLLNTYLGRMTEIIFQYGGTIDEFIGDAILALFGAPVAREDDAQRAVACAIEMQRSMAAVNARLADQGLPAVEMGIALNTGEVVVGNIGSERRAKYGVVGSNVNLTARIESYTVGGQLLVSEATLAEAGNGLVETGTTVQVKAKGLPRPIPAHEVLGIGAPFSLRMPDLDEHLVELRESVPVELSVLEGKQLTDRVVPGVLLRLSPLGAEMRCDLTIEGHTNLKLELVGARPSGEPILAKVTGHPPGRGHHLLRFTSLPPDVQKILQDLLERQDA